MRTDDLIAALATEVAPVDRRAVAKRLGVYALAVLPVSAAVMVMWLHLRQDLAEAVFSGFFWVKLAYALALALTGFLMAERLSRPAAPFQRPAASAVRVIFGMAVWGAAALYLTPAPERLATWLGGSYSVCGAYILTLSLPMLAAALLATRQGAPTKPRLAGLACGLFAGGLGAAVYCLHCPESAAPFLATWYTLGMLATAALGALLGPLTLKWR
ncbi:MAG: DUF1109 domain-containing protein [Pseudomonadota bacterium]|jgi:hypothetical protein